MEALAFVYIIEDLSCSQTCAKCTSQVVSVETWARGHAEAVERSSAGCVYLVIDIHGSFQSFDQVYFLVGVRYTFKKKIEVGMALNFQSVEPCIHT